MPNRELVAVVLGPLVVAAILWLPAWVFLALLAVVVGAAGFELLTMARAAGVPCGRVLPLLALLTILVGSWTLGARGALGATIGALVLLPAVQLVHPTRPAGGLSGAAVACFTPLYLGLCGACLGWLRIAPRDKVGVGLILLLLVTIWVGDSGAYYVGRRFGRHRMSPLISPKKTWEGLAAGVVTTYLAAAACKVILDLPYSWGHLAALATILAVAAPLGDLVESLFKRDTGVKDSSTALLDHGGFLDRTDSILYSAPPVLAYLVLTRLVP